MNYLINFFHEWKLCLVPAVTATILLAILPYLSQYPGAAIIQGLFILLTAALTSLLAFNTYKKQQLISRLQNIYFEDTLLGLAKSIEEMMSQTKKNMLLIENLVNLANHISELHGIDINTKKDTLSGIFYSTSQKIEAGLNTNDFKKYTLSRLLFHSIENPNMLTTWVDRFETDSYRFSLFLQSEIFTVKTLLIKLDASNLQNFQKCVKNLYGLVDNNYTLIRRHDILLYLYSEIVLEYSSENHSSIAQLQSIWRNEKFQEISEEINIAFSQVVTKFDERKINISEITEDQAKELNMSIEMLYTKLRKKLTNTGQNAPQ